MSQRDLQRDPHDPDVEPRSTDPIKTEKTSAVGEIAALLRADRDKDVFGAKLVPMTDAPGIVAAKAVTSFEADAAPRRGLFARLRTPALPGQLDPASCIQGRAVQAGGPSLSLSVDGVRAKRPVKRVTFYRHLRDLQIVRP